jgi:hypothetical protein
MALAPLCISSVLFVLNNLHSKDTPMKPILKTTLALLTAATLAACGGGGGSGSPTAAPVNVTGQVTKGPVSGATVCAFKLVNGAKGDKIACVQSAADSSYTIVVPADTEIVLEASGGNYTDEATGANTVLTNTLASIGKTAGTTAGTDNIVITPLTTAATKTDAAGMNIAKYKAQLVKIAALLGVSEVDLSKQLSTFNAANKPTSKYDVVLGAISQMLADGKSMDEIVAMLKASSLDASTYTTVGAAVKKYVAAKGVTVAVSTPVSATATTKTCKVNWIRKPQNFQCVTAPCPADTFVEETGSLCVSAVPIDQACETSSKITWKKGTKGEVHPKMVTSAVEDANCTGSVQAYEVQGACVTSTTIVDAANGLSMMTVTCPE